MKRRRWSVIVLVAVLLAACGDDPLSDFGNVSDWLGESQPSVPTTEPVAVGEERPLRSIAQVAWYNGLASGVPTDPDEAVRFVWERSTGSDSFVQSAPNEIAAAVPGIRFPTRVPTRTAQVTSQLVFATRTGTLTNSIVAAFGLWSTIPYTASYSISQVAVLKVAVDSTATEVEIGDPTGGCGRFSTRDEITACDPIQIDGQPAWWVKSLDGDTLVWYIDGFRYEYWDRAAVGRLNVEDMVRSMAPLGSLDILVPVGGSGGT
ncbi:MAG: hypothetical protein OEO77_07400 [Acidimicrobiia bacterium]|nr:hypothetical protein [Acidimicrobiia bacterium]